MLQLNDGMVNFYQTYVADVVFWMNYSRKIVLETGPNAFSKIQSVLAADAFNYGIGAVLL